MPGLTTRLDHFSLTGLIVKYLSAPKRVSGNKLSIIDSWRYPMQNVLYATESKNLINVNPFPTVHIKNI